MKKIAITALLCLLNGAPANADTEADAEADTEASHSSRSIGVNYGVDHVLGIQGEYDISSVTGRDSYYGQVFLKNYSQDTSPGVTWGTTGIGAAVLFDFNAVGKLDKIHPYLGIGLVYVTYSWEGAGPSQTYSGVGSGGYLTGGIRYPLAPKVDGDLNYNSFGDLTFGVNYFY
jgi:hypothetical protein